MDDDTGMKVVVILLLLALGSLVLPILMHTTGADVNKTQGCECVRIVGLQHAPLFI